MKQHKKFGKKKVVLLVILAVLLVLIIIGWPQISWMLAILNARNSSDIQEAKKESLDRFSVQEYSDDVSGLDITYNIFLPDGYSEDQKYPMIVFIADQSSVGSGETTPLTYNLGGLIWASDAEQEKHPAIVVVPYYTEVILNDNDGKSSMTDYVEATGRMIEYLESEYSVDEDRVYGTGQSMGAMTTLYLAANHPDLYAAVLIVDGQWDINALSGITGTKFTYFAAGGDAKASEGQQEVKDMLKNQGISYGELTDVDARADNTDAVTGMYSQGYDYNFITYKTGTVLPWYVPTGVDEHMLSFNWGYRIGAVRDWLFAQTK
ncbi:MAG: alpha/beta hydrolase-fold protein [Lachnospiraceae bacterium]